MSLHVRAQQEGSCLKPQRGWFHQEPKQSGPHLRLSAARTLRHKCLLSGCPVYGISVTEAQSDEDSQDFG